MFQKSFLLNSLDVLLNAHVIRKADGLSYQRASCAKTRAASDANYWTIRTLFIATNTVLGGIRTCLGVSIDLMFLWISCPLHYCLFEATKQR